MPQSHNALPQVPTPDAIHVTIGHVFCENCGELARVISSTTAVCHTRQCKFYGHVFRLPQARCHFTGDYQEVGD